MTPPDVRMAGCNRPNAGEKTADASIVSAFDPHAKSLANATAKAAIAGFTLHELAAGGYLLSRGMLRELPSLYDVHALLAQMGVAS